MTNLLVILMIVALAVNAICIIVKNRKKGFGCTGCPNSENCGKSECGKEKRNQKL